MGTSALSNDDTDRHPAIRFQHASPTAMRYLDNLIGDLKVMNGGFGEITIKLSSGRTDDIAFRTSMKPSDWRKVVLLRIA